MFSKTRFWWIILFTLFFQIPFLFSGEIYHWVDEKGTTHFTDDISKIPERYIDRAEKIKVREEKLEEGEKIEKLEERSDQVNPVRNSSEALNPTLRGGTRKCSKIWPRCSRRPRGPLARREQRAFAAPKWLRPRRRGIISNGVKDYLEDIEKKIAMKKSMEKKISELEEELSYLKNV